MQEPYATFFRRLVEQGAGVQDIHDSPLEVGYAAKAKRGGPGFIATEASRTEALAKSLCPLLEQHVGRVHSVLDVGCGTGGGTVALALSERLGARRVVGTDPNPLSLRAAEIRAAGFGLDLERIRFVASAAGQPLPFNDGEFDLTVCVSVWEFVSTEEARRDLAAELQRVTAEGGHIFLATPTPFRLRELHSRRLLGALRRTGGFPWPSTPWSIRRSFRGCHPVSLNDYHRKICMERYGRRISSLPDWALSSAVSCLSTWQRFLFRKNCSEARFLELKQRAA